jgi:hypothetical protein
LYEVRLEHEGLAVFHLRFFEFAEPNECIGETTMPGCDVWGNADGLAIRLRGLVELIGQRQRTTEVEKGRRVIAFLLRGAGLRQ